MKRYLLMALAIVSAASCSRDLGNYDYRNLDEPVISGIEENIERLTQEQLAISPVITGGLSEDSYDYEWKTIDKNGESEGIIIGQEKNLDYKVILSPGEYALY